jgi:hypothetical protein
MEIHQRQLIRAIYAGHSWHDAEARVVARDALRHGFHGGFKVVVSRIDKEPLPSNLVRHQRREVGLNGRVIRVVRTDQAPVPLPAAGFGWLDEHQHLTP